MASGQVNRIKRPNTWLQRLMLQNREESSCQTGAVHTWHKADQPIALGDVRFRGTSELALSTCDAARPSVAAAPLYPGWHRHRTVLADAAPRLLGGMGLRRGPRRATDTRTEWPANETGSQTGLFL
jgi:hypothetical protein